MKNAVRISNLYYKDIIKDISLDIEEGQIYSLVGDIGCGKTTLLKLISGILDYNGKIEIYNNDNITVNKNIGLFNNLILLYKETTFLNLIEPLLNLGYEEEKAKDEVYKISKKLNLNSILYSNINELSYSEKKLVIFAKSIIHNPKIYLLDNLFEGLDSKNKKSIISFLKSKKDKTIIYSTNDIDNILLSNKCIFMKKGTILDVIDTNDLINNIDLFKKSNIKMPFILELSNKLKLYNVIENDFIDEEKLIEAIWK